MRIDIVTVLPGLLKGPFDESIVKRGIDKGLVEVHVHNLRDWSTNKHNKVANMLVVDVELILMQLMKTHQ